ncbi:PQ loop repeat protein [Talaromyces proteolyticus]|uniref:PQ loop repeat protein n=1 Tax=Talaromyces proteolyticus TaxID=1131652 RepID=A0AAD4L5U7_9EURO|nr:PQ loop repeat protein [Talaromyces proteolyticus]KAH8704112.1 PQ loop repeat protein [Talaromyces proteolyticus]
MSFSSGHSLPQHCEPSSEFLALLSSTLHICIPSTLGLISSILGCLSIVSWLFAQLPQIYKNYKLQSTAGLSAFFLVEWCLGDTTNLVGALLTRQASWQVTIASYYVFVDVVLVFQHYWYTYVKKSHKGKDSAGSSFDDDDDNASVFEGIRIDRDTASKHAQPSPLSRPSEPKDVGIPKKYGSESPQFYSPSYSEKSNHRRVPRESGASGSLPLGVSPKTIMLTSMLCAVLANASPTPSTNPTTDSSHHLNTETIGRILSWMSTILYLGSRLPQLYKNYIRKSTSGLSPLLFMAAFSGNFFYSASLLTNPNAWFDFAPYGGGGWADADGNNREEWVALALPFFLGAAGVLSLDAFVGVQFLLYGERDAPLLVKVDDPNDSHRQRWRRVSGWMRGWVPSGEFNRLIRSNSRSTTASQGEQQALLVNDTDRDERHGYGAV